VNIDGKELKEVFWERMDAIGDPKSDCPYCGSYNWLPDDNIEKCGNCKKEYWVHHETEYENEIRLKKEKEFQSNREALTEAMGIIKGLLERKEHSQDCLNYADPKECECGLDKLEEKAEAFLKK